MKSKSNWVKLYCPACDKLSMQTHDGKSYTCKCGLEAWLIENIIIYKRALKLEEILRLKDLKGGYKSTQA